jgi:phosphate transport system permease protein
LSVTADAPVLAGPVRGARRDRALASLTATALVVALGTLGFIPIYIVAEALPFFTHYDLLGFLVTDHWVPLRDPPSLGILHAWVATVYVTLLALLIAVPLGFGIGIYAVEVAPSWARNILRPCLELLAGIPSVVYGFFGYVTLIPLFEWMFGMATGESVLAAGTIVAVMVLPFIASTSGEAFAAVSPQLREAALSLGITRAHLVRRIILAQALPGMFAGVALGFARAIGETLAALLLIGNSVLVPLWPTDRGQTLTGLIATDLGESPLGTPIYHSLFAAGAMLLLVVLAINTGIWWMKNRLIRDAA